MILYLDASALVKRYVAEAGSEELARLIATTDLVGTSLTSRAETSAALAKAARIGILTREGASSALQIFRAEWPLLVRIQATEVVLARADALTWELNLRGYDAVHLASALIWQESMGEAVTLATFDRQLWEAAEQRGIQPFPEALPSWLDS